MIIERRPAGLSIGQKRRAGNLRRRNMPPGIPPEMAEEFMARIIVGLVEKPDQPVDFVPGFLAKPPDCPKDLFRLNIERKIQRLIVTRPGREHRSFNGHHALP
jgi:hypothetical protein